MQKATEIKIFRVIDVNLNRCKEGLRVSEDIFRFILEDDWFRKKVRALRHALDRLPEDKRLKDRLLSSRDAFHDLGKKVDSLEFKRGDVSDMLYINLQRVKESLRVLEEFFKIISPDKVGLIKKSRYQIYELERKAHKKFFHGSRGS